MMERVRTSEEYVALMGDVVAACRSFAVIALRVTDEDLAAAIATVQRAIDVGHIVDPTAYRDRLTDGGLHRQRRLLLAVQAFRAELRALFP